MVRRREGQRADVCVLVLGKSEIPRGTMSSVLRQAHVSVEEFTAALR